MSEFGYVLAGIGIGLITGFWLACYTMGMLIKDQPEKFASYGFAQHCTGGA